jgi:hypothetical protein
MVVLHNPSAHIPLDPALIPGANHESCGRMGDNVALARFPYYFSQTAIAIEGVDDCTAG